MNTLLNDAKHIVNNMDYGQLEVFIHLAIRRQREIKTQLESTLNNSEVAQ